MEEEKTSHIFHLLYVLTAIMIPASKRKFWKNGHDRNFKLEQKQIKSRQLCKYGSGGKKTINKKKTFDYAVARDFVLETIKNFVLKNSFKYW